MREFDPEWTDQFPSDGFIRRLLDISRVLVSVISIYIPNVHRLTVSIDTGPIYRYKAPACIDDLTSGLSRRGLTELGFTGASPLPTRSARHRP